MQLAQQLAHLTPGSVEWLTLRRQGLGASEVPAILGLDPYKTPFQLWLEKTGQLPVVASDSPQSRVGRFAESMIASLYEDTTGESVITVDPVQHDTLPFLFASADRAVIGGEALVPSRLVEIKNRGGLPKGWGESGTQEIPESVYIQTAIQSACYKIPRVDVAALLGGNDFRVYPLEIPDWLAQDLLEQVDYWWAEHVVKGIEPPITGAGASEYLAKKWKSHRDELLEVPAFDSTLLQLFDVRDKIAELETVKEDLEVQIKATIGDAAGLIVPGVGKVTWKKAKDSTSTDWKGLAQSFNPTPEQIAAFDVTKPGSRRFLPTRA